MFQKRVYIWIITNSFAPLCLCERFKRNAYKLTCFLILSNQPTQKESVWEWLSILNNSLIFENDKSRLVFTITSLFNKVKLSAFIRVHQPSPRHQRAIFHCVKSAPRILNPKSLTINNLPLIIDLFMQLFAILCVYV